MRKRISDDFGKRLKHARESKKMTVRYLGSQAGISSTAVYNIENGTAVTVRLENALALADALGVSREWLCWNEGAIERKGRESREFRSDSDACSKDR